MSTSSKMEELLVSPSGRSRLLAQNNYLAPETSLFYLEYISRLPLHHEPEFMMYGKVAKMHRSVGFFSNKSKGYTFTGITIPAQPLGEELQYLVDNVNRDCGTDFNAILINVYHTKEDYIGAHRDSLEGLSSSGVVALSLGASRIFRIRDLERRILGDFPTQSGQLLVMNGDFQNELYHEIPPGRKGDPDGLRISLTFRSHRE